MSQDSDDSQSRADGINSQSEDGVRAFLQRLAQKDETLDEFYEQSCVHMITELKHLCSTDVSELKALLQFVVEHRDSFASDDPPFRANIPSGISPLVPRILRKYRGKNKVLYAVVARAAVALVRALFPVDSKQYAEGLDWYVEKINAVLGPGSEVRLPNEKIQELWDKFGGPLFELILLESTHPYFKCNKGSGHGAADVDKKNKSRNVLYKLVKHLRKFVSEVRCLPRSISLSVL
jgi:hypothetical protein